MSLPRFLSRIEDAAGPLLSGIERSAIGERLEQTSLAVRIDAESASDSYRAGFLLAVNLAARLYPTLVIEAPGPLNDQAQQLAQAINPNIELRDGDAGFEVCWGAPAPTAQRVTLACAGWMVAVDADQQPLQDCAPVTAMAAAALGMGEIFRAVFADALRHGRSAAAPWTLNVITLSDEPVEYEEPTEVVDLGEIWLAGCGAIGQAAVAALTELPVRGTLHAVDHEPVDLGNLQRYVLTTDADEDAPKPDLVERALAAHDLTVVKVPTRWGDDQRSGPGVDTVMTALDSKSDRISVQASLPRRIYNAWTQPEDVGVSRHESFGGDQPCLACLYWPRQPRPSDSQLIAEALSEHELRVVSYLVHGLSVSQPLPSVMPTLRLAAPADAETWLQRPLLEDVAARFGLNGQEARRFGSLKVDELYRSGICGSLLLEAGTGRNERPETVSVPLAHQSTLAGVMLAIQVYAAQLPALRALRPPQIEAGYDLLRGGHQELWRPPAIYDRCICRDGDFVSHWQSLWQSADRDGSAS